jgi:hypothetical protein
LGMKTFFRNSSEEATCHCANVLVTAR